MILQNKDGIDKIFINDNLKDHIEIYDIDDKCKCIKFNSDRFIELVYSEDEISLLYIEQIYFKIEENKLYFYNDEQICTCEDSIDDNEIVSLSLGEKGDRYQIIEFSTMKLPKFVFEKDFNKKYPKFEVNISDCIYNMRIYINGGGEYIDIPDFQSHYSIHSTLDYITQLIYYLDEWRPKFIECLCNNDNMSLMITSEQNKINCGILQYKLGEEGLYLTGGELEDYLVKWQEFFKLIMDGKWEVNFEDE